MSLVNRIHARKVVSFRRLWYREGNKTTIVSALRRYQLINGLRFEESDVKLILQFIKDYEAYNGT